MAEQIKGIGKSPVPSKTQEPPVYERREKANVESGVPGFSASFANAATTPTALGELGANLSMRMGIELAKRRGESLGNEPEGDLLPPITKVDESFVKAYSTQAQAVLGNQITTLMDKAQEEVSQAYKITPDIIKSYTENVGQSVQDILDKAPNTIKSQMTNQYSMEMQNSLHKLTMNMISQDKETSKSEASAYYSRQLQAMHSSLLSGNLNAGKALYDDITAANKSNLEAGLITPLQAETNNNTAKINYFSGIETKKALDARKNKSLEGFLSDMIDNKPDELNWSEWETVRNQVIGYVGAIENFDNRDQSLKISQANARAALGPLNPDYIANLKNDLQPTKFNNFMASYVSRQNSKNLSNAKVQHIQANWTDTLGLLGADKKDINKAFYSMADEAIKEAKEKGRPIDEDEAKLMVASTAGIPIPAYIDELNRKLTSGNPALMMRAFPDLVHLKEQNGNVASGVTKNAEAMGTLFNHLLEQGLDPNLAAEKAEQTIFGQTDEQKQLTQQVISEWRRSTLKDSAHKRDWALQLAGLSKGTNIQNADGFANYLQRIMEENIAVTKNIDVSQKMLESSLNTYWGYTEVNGNKQYTFMPIEKAIGLDSGALPLIKQNLAYQLDLQFEESKKAYDDGNLDYYIKLKEMPDFEKYKSAKEALKEKRSLTTFAKNLVRGTRPKDFSEEEIVKKYESTEPLEIEVVQRDGSSKTYKAVVEPSPMMQMSSGTLPVIGDWDVNIINDKGFKSAIPGAYPGHYTHAKFRPNAEWIKQNYFAVNGINQDLSEKAIQELTKYRRGQEDALNPRSMLLHRGIF